MIRVALPLLLLAVGPVCAQNEGFDTHEWLDRMNAAVEKLNYRGTFIHVTAGQVEAMRVIHRVQEGVVTERLISLDGSGREVLRTPHETRCVIKAQQAVLVDRNPGASPLRAALPEFTDELARLYKFKGGAWDRVAGRRTRIIEVYPMDSFRYGYRLWLDESTAMPLQSMMVTADAAVVEQIKFTDIDFPDTIDADELQPELAVEGFKVTVQDSPADTDKRPIPRWQVNDLPDGFQLSVANRQSEDDSAREHLVYSDGLASVSVFVEPIVEDEPVSSGLATMGGSNAFSTTVEGYQVIVVGEVPKPTVRMIGESMQSLVPVRK